MLPSVPDSSTSISSAARPRAIPFALRVAAASWRAMAVERFHQSGLMGYLAVWLARPIFEISIAALVYGRARPDLLRYAVVALAANAFVFNAIFYVGEILDRERLNGTLVGLFLAPCPRLSWLSGFTLVGAVETALIAAVALGFGHVAFGVSFDPDVPAILVALALLLVSLWGLGYVFSAAGLAIKKANQLSNVILPFAVLLGGVYYPVALLPTWLRFPARLLPLGYGMQALADATLHHAGIHALLPQLVPLAGFAVVLPIVGVLSFRLLERLVRVRGELDL